MSKDNYNPIKTENGTVGFHFKAVGNISKTIAELISPDIIPDGTNICFIQVSNGAIEDKNAQLNYKLDGTAVTQTAGHSLGETDTLKLNTRAEIDQFTCISRNAENVFLAISFSSTSGNS